MSPAQPAFAAAILLAAGRSTRMRAPGSEQERKPFLLLRGRSVLERAVAAFEAARSVGEIVLVGHQDDVARLRELAARGALGKKLSGVVAGGAERTDSVREGARGLTRPAEVVLVHDVARPLVMSALVDTVALAARTDGAALLAFPVHDTIKRSRDGRTTHETLDRRELWAARTPQAFRADRLREMLDRADAEHYRPTDDAALHERYFGPVTIVEDHFANWKLTIAEDFVLANAWLARMEDA